MTWHEHEAILNPLIEGVVHSAMRRFYKFVERDDLRQELVIWCLTHQNKVAQYLEEERDYSITKALDNAALKFCQQEKAATSGYKMDDIFWWQRADLEGLLPALFSNDDWLNPPMIDADHRGKRPPSEGGNWIAGLVDISRAYSQLDIQSQAVLRLVYGQDMSRVRVGELYDVSDQTIHNWIDKAVTQMHRDMGGHRPRHDPAEQQVTGSRKAITNARAAALTRGQYGDE